MKRIFQLLFLLVLPLHLAVAQSSGGLSPMDVARLQSVGDVYASPDQDLVAYTLRVQADPTVENVPARYHLYLMDLENEMPFPFVTSQSVRGVSFRPAHESITFLSRREGDENTDLYEISLKGGEARKIYDFETAISAYDWDADGENLAFIAREPEEKKAVELPYEPEVYEEGLRHSKAYVVPLAGPNAVPREVEVKGHAYTILWSPDGDRLVTTTAPTPLVDDFYMRQQIYIVSADSFRPVASVDHAGKLGMITWSPDSRHLAFIAGADINDPIAGRLFTVPADGGKPAHLLAGFKGMFEEIRWSDAQTIHFLASEGVWSSFGSIQADGSGFQRLIDTGGPIIEDMTSTPSGDHIFVAHSPSHPAELYLRRAGNASMERVTDHNPWLKEIPLAKQEVITYEARDGLELEGVLVHPLNREAGQRYPLVTVVHGGPESHYDNGWVTSYSTVGQMGAARGFAVFYPNYRGSTGRGEEFAKSSQGDLAGMEFDDIVDGVDHLIATGLADREKVGVTGGSYGGYATGWLSTKYTDRFAAGVMFVGISNNLSKWGTSDIPEELYLVHARKRVWDDYEFFLKRSPIYYAGQSETPLLILAGKEDTRVHPSQSIELYRHIKVRTDTPVRLVLYPGEGHGNRNATAQLDYSLRSLRWFQKYLQGKDTEMDTKVEVDVQEMDR